MVKIKESPGRNDTGLMNCVGVIPSDDLREDHRGPTPHLGLGEDPRIAQSEWRKYSLELSSSSGPSP